MLLEMMMMMMIEAKGESFEYLFTVNDPEVTVLANN